MTCSESREYLIAFLDSELDAPLSIELQRHLEHCPDCAREAEIERAIRQQLVQALQRGNDMAGADEAWLAQAVARIAGRSTRRRFWRALGACAAAIVIVISALWMLRAERSAPGSPPHLADLVIDDFQHFLAKGRPVQLASADAAELSTWLRNQTHLDVTLPPAHGHCKLLGARRCTIAQRPAALASYEMRGTPATVVVIPGTPADLEKMQVVEQDGRTHWVDRCRGHTVVACRRGDLIYAAVSTLGEAQLVHLMEAAPVDQ